MTSTVIDMLQRYRRAAELSAQNIATDTAGIPVEGYWIGEDRFFFLAEKIEPSLGRMLAIPSIANCEAGRVEEIIPLEALALALSNQSGRAVDLEALSSADFDMPDRDTLAVSHGGQDYLVDPRRRCVIKARVSLEVPALYSPDGRYACFVRGHDLWLKEREGGAERALTTDGARYHCYGQLPEAGLQAVSYRKRPSPVGLWSPDSQWFLTRHIDERSLTDQVLVQHAPPGGGRPVLHSFKFAMPGDPLPVATYLAIHVASGRSVIFDSFPAQVTEPWNRRMDAWFSGKDTAWIVRFDRYLKQVELICLDLARGTGRIVFNETTASGYLELHQFGSRAPNVRTLPESGEVIWFSERDGWGHLYLYDAATGRLKNRITNGEWLVRDIVHVDEAQRKVLFLAGGVDPKVDPAWRSLCASNLDGSGFEVLLRHEGDVFLPKTEPYGFGQDRPFRPSQAQAGVSPGGHFGAVRYASVDRGDVMQIVDLRRRAGFVIASALPTTDEVAPPRRFAALAADGVTLLYGLMLFPSDFAESRRYPLIDCIYPGPQATYQPQSFRSFHAMPARQLAELGFVTIMLDTRGMPSRSRTFHQIGYGSTLEPQLADHAAVVRQLCERHAFIDSGRIGMIGASAGGTATARALFDYGEIFKVGVSVCGAHDEGICGAGWTDKYRGPGNRETWAEQSNGAVAHKLEGKLLLISGDMDENVFVSNTLSLVDALVRANRDFDLLIVPNAGHEVGFVGYAQRRSWDYFVRHLLGETPPPNFAIKFEPSDLARIMKSAIREFYTATN